MNRRTFLRLGGAIGLVAAGLGAMGSKVEPGCDAGGSSQENRKPMQPKPDDGKRYKCVHPSHGDNQPLFFGTAIKDAHVKRYPGHRYYIRRYA